MMILPNSTYPKPLFTHAFVVEQTVRLLAAARQRASQDPDLGQILHCLDYFGLYTRQLSAGGVDALIEADAPAWLAEALRLLETGDAQ